MTKRRIAVVGGGIFGTTAAIRLAEDGHKVELFEQAGDILTAASCVNQYRLHRGYHYPRSPETAIACRDDEGAFVSLFRPAVLHCFDHYFGIARRESLTSAADYLSFLDSLKLEYRREAPDFLSHDELDTCVRVRESVFDLRILRERIWSLLHRREVRVHLEREFLHKDKVDYDTVVVATYASLNALLPDWCPPPRYQFEVVEKPVLRLPPHMQRKSVVIMDGPFMCLDPMGTSGLSVMGHVEHGVHHSNVGSSPSVPPHLATYLNAGIVKNPPFTKVKLFLESAAQFFPQIEKAEHVGSMYTVRTVLPDAEKTDARPTIVSCVGDMEMVTIFSGKIGSCVRAADRVVALLW